MQPNDAGHQAVHEVERVSTFDNGLEKVAKYISSDNSEIALVQGLLHWSPVPHCDIPIFVLRQYPLSCLSGLDYLCYDKLKGVLSGHKFGLVQESKHLFLFIKLYVIVFYLRLIYVLFYALKHFLKVVLSIRILTILNCSCSYPRHSGELCEIIESFNGDRVLPVVDRTLIVKSSIKPISKPHLTLHL